MSEKNDYAKVVSKLTTFRSHSSELLESQMGLIEKILNNVQDLFDKNLQNLSEVERGRLEFYNDVLPEMKKCLAVSGKFTESTTKDYAQALKLLSKMNGGSNNG
ncbi:hypothetical protein [Enterobacter bugandensis]|uniref:hypothetical protein n=1 Tax=Enterobacter bugandensis TaxID=881260 RepID=UPI002A7F43FA|nr:hypothetical protein [Enterobacter bugandensis]